MPVTVTIKKAKKMLADRLAKFGSRQELVSKYGYDTKFASHLIRLLKEGKELLVTSDLKFPLAYRGSLRAIRAGKFSMDDVLSFAGVIESEVESLYDVTGLPHYPNRELVEKFVIDTHRRYIVW